MQMPTATNEARKVIIHKEGKRSMKANQQIFNEVRQIKNEGLLVREEEELFPIHQWNLMISDIK